MFKTAVAHKKTCFAAGFNQGFSEALQDQYPGSVAWLRYRVVAFRGFLKAGF
jgi:hypothetical protein